MKISSGRAVTVQVPITRMAVFSKRKMTHMLSTIVEVETDAGILGLGEVRGVWPAQIINEKFACISDEKWRSSRIFSKLL